MFEGTVLLVSTPGIIAVRLILSLILIGVQFCVFKAGSRMLAGMESGWPFARRLNRLAFAFFVAVNIPLAVFVAESVFSPRQVIFYSPPIRYEAFVRPVSYVFFVWTIGSLFFVAAAPIFMGLLALFQFSDRRRSQNDQNEAGASVQALDLSRRRFLQLFLAGVAAVPFAASAYGAVAAKRSRTIETVNVSIPNLPKALDGFRIVQLSDIHAGLFMTAEQVSEWTRIANGLNADLIALTGDFVASRTSEVYLCMRGIAGLKAKYGVFASLGNHDMFTNSEEVIEREFEKAGFVLLRNRNQYVEIGDARLNMIGVDFISDHAPQGERLPDILRRISLDGPTVLLSHNPNTFEEAARAGIDLTLSGHTHGGQIALKIGDVLIAPARLATIFIAGLFKIGDSQLYVNRGLGTTGPPIRINAPPEITVMTLRTAS